MARGDTGERETNTGIMLAAILGLLALGALVVVAFVTYEDDDPPIAAAGVSPAIFQNSTSGWRFCSDRVGSGVRADVDAELRARGYVPAGEWHEAQSAYEPVSAEELVGGCGVLVAISEDGSSVDGHRGADGLVDSCRRDRWSTASCGEPVQFSGRGDIFARAYVMAGVTPGSIPPEHMMAHAEAEHALQASGFEPKGDLIYYDEQSGTDVIRLDAPSSGCSYFVLVGTGGMAHLVDSSSHPIDHSPYVQTVGACAGLPSPELRMLSGSGWVSVRSFVPGGNGLARPSASQISAAQATTRLSDVF